MKPSALSFPGYRINEYLLVLRPPEEVGNKVKAVKKEFYDKYKAPGALSGETPVILVGFMQYAVMEQRIINGFSMLAMGYRPFNIELNDFGSYPSHTIYINVTSTAPVLHLLNDLRGFQQTMQLNNHSKALFSEEPHIAIASKLMPWQYERSWAEYSRKIFSGGFMADDMLLLRRQVGVNNSYQAVRRFEFASQAISVGQSKFVPA